MTATEESSTVLSEAHAEELTSSAISPEHVVARGYRTLYGSDTDRQMLKNLQVPRWAWRDDSAWPLLYLPLYRVTGEVISCQVKPAVPQKRHDADTRPMKYSSAAGPLHVDVPPLVADAVRDVSVPLWITEGLKKADALASKNRAVVTLTGVFNWRSKHGTLGDWEDIPLRERSVVVCFDADAREKRDVLLAMRRLGKWLESKRVREVRYLITPGEVNGTAVKGVDDYFAAGGTMEDLRDAVLRELPVDGPADAAFTDSVLADTLCAEELEGQYRWAAGLGWMKWTGRVWTECTDVTVTETVRNWALEQFQRVLDKQRTDPHRDSQTQMDGWRSTLGSSRLRALVGLAKGILECSAEAFDADPNLLNCPNGVADLRTGQLMPADPDLMMTKIAGSDYVKGATHPDWDQALTALPDDVREWFRVRIGQALTGHTPPDDLVVISQGGGSNGKSTVADTLSTAFGKYHTVVADRAMLGNASENHPTELMDFRGARYAILEETPESRQLDMVRVKKLAGTGEITARRIRQDSVTFQATHSLFINTNYKPVVTETDHGSWRRLALLRWPYTYRRTRGECRGSMDRVGDSTLRQRVKSDPRVLEAALAWAVSGAADWYAADSIMPEMPDRVRRDTAAWRMESDPVLGFISECLVFDRDSHVLSSELWTRFCSWMEEKQNKEWSQKTFLARFGGHDACSQNGVEMKIMKPRAGLSRLNGSSATGSTYRAWRGLRFARPDEGLEADHDTPESSFGSEADSADLQGYGSYASAVNGSIARDSSVIGKGVTAVTSCEAQPLETVPETPRTWSADAFGGDPATSDPTADVLAHQNTHSDDDEVGDYLTGGFWDDPEIPAPAGVPLPRAEQHDEEPHDQPTTDQGDPFAEDDDFWEL